MKNLLRKLFFPSKAFARSLRALLYFLLAIGLVIAMVPSDYIDTGLEVSDKIQHATAFFGFAVLLDASSKLDLWKQQFPLLFGYGLLIEILQSFVSWRTFSLLDLLADVVGLLLYWFLIRQILLPRLAR